MERRTQVWAILCGAGSILCGIAFFRTYYLPVVIPQYVFFVLYLMWLLKYFRVKNSPVVQTERAPVFGTGNPESYSGGADGEQNALL